MQYEKEIMGIEFSFVTAIDGKSDLERFTVVLFSLYTIGLLLHSTSLKDLLCGRAVEAISNPFPVEAVFPVASTVFSLTKFDGAGGLASFFHCLAAFLVPYVV